MGVLRAGHTTIVDCPYLRSWHCLVAPSKRRGGISCGSDPFGPLVAYGQAHRGARYAFSDKYHTTVPLLSARANERTGNTVMVTGTSEWIGFLHHMAV